MARPCARALFVPISLAAIAAAGCSDASRQSATPLSPSASPVVAPAPVTPASGTAATTTHSTVPGNASGGERPLTLPDVPAWRSLAVAFPGRDESFLFRQELERKYRDGLRRAATSSFVDIEGDLVWTQEYLRYRVNQCGHADAVQRVLDQIDGRPAGPVCGEAPRGTVLFPPRNEPFDFRMELERKYRDGLRRSPSATFVDLEGAIVWTQEYLRYRVNACGHVAATQKVMDQIDGRGIAAVCNADLSGVWDGTSSYFNAPFVMDLVQAGSAVSGTYQDQHDRGFVSGTLTGTVVNLRVNFGDTGILVEARWDGADVVNGDLTIGGGVGRRSFEMVRRR